MREVKEKRESFFKRASLRLDSFVGMFSPRAALGRSQYRFAYEALDKHRLRTKRTATRLGGDQQLSEQNLDKLREICRDLGANNPLVKGIYRKLATAIVGTLTRIQARSSDEGWNKGAEDYWKAEMVDKPCEITGRFGFHQLLWMQYYHKLRDGDTFQLFLRDTLQAVMGEQCGTPWGGKAPKLNPKYYDLTNGVAVSKKTKKVIGYYIGRPNKWGYIEADSWKQYKSDRVHHMFGPERFDQSRGEPILTPSVTYIDHLFGYVNAELVAAKVNACFPLIAKTMEGNSMGGPLGQIVTSGGTDKKDDYERPLSRMEPGQIWEGIPGEELSALGAARPARAFDSFTMRAMAIIGCPVGMPLMLISGDFSGATFMNSRFAFGQARDFYINEQELCVKPQVRKTWRWKMLQGIESKELSPAPEDWSQHEIFMKRWPYVDPFKESKADEQQLKNGTTTRTIICARQGLDFADIVEQRATEDKLLKDKGVKLIAEKKSPPVAKETNDAGKQ